MTDFIQVETDAIELPQNRVPVAAHVDVLVAGGGPSGFGAGIGAAREGAATLLVERNAVLGGVATVGGMNTWNVPPDKMSGIAREVADHLIDSGHAVAGPTVPFDVQALKELMVERLLASRAQLLLYTWAVEPLVQDGCVKGLLVINKSGMQAILAKAVVDATGDGDILAGAGAEMVKGRESDGRMRPISVLFRLGGVDIKRIVEHAKNHPDQFSADPNFHILDIKKGLVRICGFFDLMAQAKRSGQIEGDINYIRFEGVQVDRGIVTVNNSRVYGIDGTNAWDLTKADIEARRQNKQLFELIKHRVPGCEHSYVLDSSAIGVRETRRIRGSYVLREEDIAARRSYDDCVARVWRFHAPGQDWHSPDGGEGGPQNLTYRTEETPLNSYEIPYRCFVPNGVDGILAAGRTLSQTQRADMYTRGQYTCMVTGQVSVTAAALAAREELEPRDLDVHQLQRMLVQSGVDVGAAAAVLQ
jgi:hypothetical protein